MKAISEVISSLEGKTEKEKIQAITSFPAGLQQSMEILAKFAYDKNVVMQVPRGMITYSTVKNTDDPYAICHVTKNMYYMVIPLSDKFSPKKLENMFLDALEDLVPGDAELLLNVRDKKIPNLTRSIVMKAFPGLIE